MYRALQSTILLVGSWLACTAQGSFLWREVSVIFSWHGPSLPLPPGTYARSAII
jgi:hypothetical protein